MKYAYGPLDIEQTTDKSSEQCTKMITSFRHNSFHSICEKRNDKNSLKNIDIVYAFLLSLIIVHGTYVLVLNNSSSKQLTSIKLPDEMRREPLGK